MSIKIVIKAAVLLCSRPVKFAAGLENMAVGNDFYFRH